MLTLPPLSLYIHIPWCVQKCPYCDFNSHSIKAKEILPDGSSPQMALIPEDDYVKHLLLDLDADLKFVQNRPLQSIFIGGGTPSILEGKAIQALLDGVRERLTLVDDCEITLEANPGTVDQGKFEAFKKAGVTRLSIGIQSFNPEHLKVLGRIHDKEQAKEAVAKAHAAGFERINVDLMFGLPDQSIESALSDLEQALALKPTHLSWYQLTLEPNTLFYYKPPPLPDDDYIWEIEQAGKKLLASRGFKQYEVSAYASQPEQQCRHNLAYWNFADYLGIGCGAASKVTTLDGIWRLTKTKHPKGYLEGRYLQEMTKVPNENLLFEYFLNRFRLFTPLPKADFSLLTGQAVAQAEQRLAKFIEQGYIVEETHEGEECWNLTDKGHIFLNTILMDLLPEDED